MQIAASQFSSVGQGHAFALRVPTARATARRCRDCGADVFEHSRLEVAEADVMKILEVGQDRVPSQIAPHLLVGGCFAVMACSEQPDLAVLNCAGTALHAFFPKTRAPFDALRAAGRLRDLEWQDSEAFQIPQDELLAALAWARAQLDAGRRLLINCAQGKSRSGAAAVAYLMQTRSLGVDAALAIVQAGRALVEPNPSFMRQLRALEGAIRAAAPPNEAGAPSTSDEDPTIVEAELDK